MRPSTMELNECEVLLAPSGGPAWPIEPKDDFTGGLASSLAAVAGAPIITLPCGMWRGVLPLGVALIGRRWSDETVLTVAAALEQALPPAPEPQFVPSIGGEVEGMAGNSGLKDAASGRRVE